MNRTIVHITNTDGHRASYRDLFVKIVAGVPSTGIIRGKRLLKLINESKVIFATLDDDYFGFVLVALLRSFRNKPTVGIFLRPLQCFRSDRPIVYRGKRFVFMLLNKLPKINLLSIVPHYINPALKEVTRDWIYDPQMWDLWLDDAPELPHSELSKKVMLHRRSRKVLIFIGRGNRIKGFGELVSFANAYSDRILVVVAGRVDPIYKKLSSTLEDIGMIVEDRFVTDSEVLSLYKVANFAWCVYSPEYDQASGIFGRAIQTGVTPIVRDGSVISRLSANSIILSEIEQLLQDDSLSGELCFNFNASSDGDADVFSAMINDAVSKING